MLGLSPRNDVSDPDILNYNFSEIQTSQCHPKSLFFPFFFPVNLVKYLPSGSHCICVAWQH